jgi:sulfur relay protein TusB/DsrH
MARLTMLIMSPPHSDESAQRMCGLSNRAIERGMEVAIYLLGDGVLCSKKGQRGHIGQNIRAALTKGITVRASAKDLRSRAIAADQMEQGVEVVEDLEGEFVEDVMEKATRVITW